MPRSSARRRPIASRSSRVAVVDARPRRRSRASPPPSRPARRAASRSWPACRAGAPTARSPAHGCRTRTRRRRPRAGAASKRDSALKAPRNLNAPMRWKFSHLKKTCGAELVVGGARGQHRRAVGMAREALGGIDDVGIGRQGRHRIGSFQRSLRRVETVRGSAIFDDAPGRPARMRRQRRDLRRTDRTMPATTTGFIGIGNMGLGDGAAPARPRLRGRRARHRSGARGLGRGARCRGACVAGGAGRGIATSWSSPSSMRRNARPCCSARTAPQRRWRRVRA